MQTLKSKVLHGAIVLLILFFPIYYTFDPIHLYKMIGVVSTITSLAVVQAYMPALKNSVSRSISDLDKTDILSMSIILVFTSVAIREGYITFQAIYDPELHDRGAWFYMIPTFSRYSMVIASLLALSSRQGLIGPTYLRRVPGWPRAIISLIVGVLLSMIILQLQL